jgi:phosphate uptake regulator
MEGRKLQKVGYSTLSLSLPSNWVKEMNLKRGDIVFLEPEIDGSLKIMPSKLIDSNERSDEYICNVDLCTDPKMIERIIVGNYILGREYLSIISSDRIQSKHIREIRGIIPSLIGLGIVEETSDRISIQCAIDPRKFSLDLLFRRLSIISLTIVKEALGALTNSDIALAEDAISREKEADMIYLLSMRLLISAQRKRKVAEETGLKNPYLIVSYGLMLKFLEMISDYAEGIARHVIELLQKYEEKIPAWVIEKIKTLGDLAHDLVLKSVDSFFLGDLKIANSLLEMLEFIESERDRLIKDLPEIPHLQLIIWNITRIADNGGAIAFQAINNSLEKKTGICTQT